MKSLIIFLVFICCLFSRSSSLQCYLGNSTDRIRITCSLYNSKFCVIYKYNNSVNGDCGEDYCSEWSCTDDTICKESGTSELEMYGMKITTICCDKDLCNIESIKSSAQRFNKRNFCLCIFVLIYYIFCYHFLKIQLI